MGRMVEDMLTLARLDQLPEISRKPVSLTRLAQDAADDARAAAPERRIEVASNGDVTVLGDASKLRQVIANLMRNALVHTPAGTPIELAVAADGDRHSRARGSVRQGLIARAGQSQIGGGSLANSGTVSSSAARASRQRFSMSTMPVAPLVASPWASLTRVSRARPATPSSSSR